MLCQQSFFEYEEEEDDEVEGEWTQVRGKGPFFQKKKKVRRKRTLKVDVAYLEKK